MAFIGQREMHHAAVGLAAATRDEAAPLHAIDQARHGAGIDVQPPGEFGRCRGVAICQHHEAACLRMRQSHMAGTLFHVLGQGVLRANEQIGDIAAQVKVTGIDQAARDSGQIHQCVAFAQVACSWGCDAVALACRAAARARSITVQSGPAKAEIDKLVNASAMRTFMSRISGMLRVPL